MRATPDDVALLARIAVGEEAALELLATEHHARLWRYLAHQLGADVWLIADVLQEVYLAIWDGARSCRGGARASTRGGRYLSERRVDRWDAPAKRRGLS